MTIDKIFVSFKLSNCVVATYDGDYKNIEVDLSDLTEEDLVVLATRSIKIHMQAVRTSKKPEDYAFLASKKYKMPRPGTRASTSPEKTMENAAKLLNKLTPEQLQEFLKGLEAV